VFQISALRLAIVTEVLGNFLVFFRQMLRYQPRPLPYTLFQLVYRNRPITKRYIVRATDSIDKLTDRYSVRELTSKSEQFRDHEKICMCLCAVNIFKSPMIQCRILSEHPRYTVKVHSLYATLNCSMFSDCVVV
jgi:hypothetical protein